MAEAPRDLPYTELLERLIAELDEIQQATVNEKAYLFNSFLDRVIPQLEGAVDSGLASQLVAFRVPTPTGRHIVDHTRNTLATTNVRDCRNLLSSLVRRLTDEAAQQSNLTQRKLDSLKSFLDELNNIEAALHADGYSKMEQRFARWKDRCVRFIADNFSDDEAKKLSRYKLLDSNPTIARRRHEHTILTFKKCRSFLEVMIEEIQTHGEGVSPQQPTPLTRQEPTQGVASAIDTHQPIDTANHEQANELYEKARALSRYVKPLDANTAKIIIETANDAIKEFGNTNQEKKVELKRMVEEAGKVLPPATFKELTDRAEGQLLRKTYPKSHTSRNVILLVVLLFTLVGSASIWSTLKYLRPSVATDVKSDAKDTTGGVLPPISLTVRPVVENATEVVQSLRASRQLRALSPLESGKSIETTPAGTFFFVYAGYLSKFYGANEQVYRNPGIVNSVRRTGSDFEIHKISEAQVEIMAFVSNDAAQSVSRLDGNLKKEITLSPSPWSGSTTIILIPYDRIQAAKTRDIDVDEKTSMNVLDVTLQ